MSTNGEIVSRIRNSFKFTTKDSRVPARFILQTLRSIVSNYISQRILDRTIQYDYNIYTSIECFEFEKLDSINCPIISLQRCDILMKSKKPLPKLIYSRLGSSLKSAVSIDGSTELTILDEQQYRRNKNRKYQIKGTAYLFQDGEGFLYIPDQEVLAVNIDFITLETDLVDELSACKKTDDCKSGWDYAFICPDKLLEPVIKETLQIIGATYGAVIADSNPNGIDKQPTQ